MAYIVGASGGDVLDWRGTNELFNDITKCLADRGALLLDSDYTLLLKEFSNTLSAEMEYEKRVADDLMSVFADLDKVEFDDELPAISARLFALASDYFTTRSSVGAFHAMCTVAVESLLKKIIQLTEAGMAIDEMFAPAVPSCWLIGGSAGRCEQTLRDGHGYFLIYDDPSEAAAAYYESLSYRFTTILKKIGLLHSNERDFLRDCFWHGTTEAWHGYLKGQLTERKQEHTLHLSILPALTLPFRPLGRDDGELYRGIASVADLRPVVGDMSLIDRVMDSSRSHLDAFRRSAAFEHIGRHVALLPAAVTLFGGVKVERRGAHRGTLDIERHVLDPLIMNICVLAVKYGINETNSIQRVKGLLNKGRISVDLAEKVVRAYHEIVRLDVVAQLRGVEDSEGVYVSPEELSEEEWYTLKHALDSVVNLQKMVLHDFSELT